MTPEPSEWGYVFRELRDRAVAVVRQPRAFFYVFFFGAFLGGLGCWATLVAQNYDKATGRDVVLSAATFGVALCATGVADSVLEKDKSGPFKFVLLCIGIASVIPVGYYLFALVLGEPSPPKVSALFAVGLTVAPIVTWALANAHDAKFSPRWDAAAGGPPGQRLEDK